MREINEIIIHCAATSPGWMHGSTAAQKMAEIRRWHKALGWRREGYHFGIDRDGTVVKGRPVEETGAGVKGRNSHTIHICLFGGRGAAATDKFDDHFTAEQRKAMHRTVDSLRVRFGEIPVNGHNQYANKGCPGFYVPDEFAAPAREVEHIEPETPAKPSALSAILAAIFRIFKN
jgi:hypothetical protein